MVQHCQIITLDMFLLHIQPLHFWCRNSPCDVCPPRNLLFDQTIHQHHCIPFDNPFKAPTVSRITNRRESNNSEESNDDKRSHIDVVCFCLVLVVMGSGSFVDGWKQFKSDWWVGQKRQTPLPNPMWFTRVCRSSGLWNIVALIRLWTYRNCFENFKLVIRFRHFELLHHFQLLMTSSFRPVNNTTLLVSSHIQT